MGASRRDRQHRSEGVDVQLTRLPASLRRFVDEVDALLEAPHSPANARPRTTRVSV